MLLEIKDVSKIYDKDNLEHIQIEARRQLFRYFIKETLSNITSDKIRSKVETELYLYTADVNELKPNEDVLLPEFVIYENDIDTFRDKCRERVIKIATEVINKEFNISKEIIASNNKYMVELSNTITELEK